MWGYGILDPLLILKGKSCPFFTHEIKACCTFCRDIMGWLIRVSIVIKLRISLINVQIWIVSGWLILSWWHAVMWQSWFNVCSSVTQLVLQRRHLYRWFKCFRALIPLSVFHCLLSMLEANLVSVMVSFAVSAWLFGFEFYRHVGLCIEI